MSVLLSSKQIDRTYFNSDFDVVFPNKLIELILTVILMFLSHGCQSIYCKITFSEDLRLLVKFVIYWPSHNRIRKVPKPQNIFGKLRSGENVCSVSHSMQNFTKTHNFSSKLFLKHLHIYNSASPEFEK
jgi:hypothetical protein